MFRPLLTLSFTLLVLSACQQHPQRMQAEGLAQGSTYSIVYYNDGTDLQYGIDSLLVAYDRVLSTYQDRSYISRWNANALAGMPQPEWFSDVVERAKEVSLVTDGAFDITVKPLMDLWFGNGWDVTAVDTLTIDSIMAFVGHGLLTDSSGTWGKTDPRVRIDVNAIAQGHSVDVMAEHLRNRGAADFLVEIGGEVFASGTKPDGSPWTVGIDRPSDDGNPDRELTLSLTLRDQGMATSGNYRKFIEVDGQRLGHTLDPRTGHPATTDVLSATVVAADAATADAYATAFMVMGVELSKQFISGNDRLEGILIYGQEGKMETWVSAGLLSQIAD